MSGYIIETRRVETWKFPYTFRFATNNNVRYTSVQPFFSCLSTVARIVSVGVLVPKLHGSRQSNLYSRTRFSMVLQESLSVQEPEIPRYLKNRLVF